MAFRARCQIRLIVLGSIGPPAAGDIRHEGDREPAASRRLTSGPWPDSEERDGRLERPAIDYGCGDIPRPSLQGFLPGHLQRGPVAPGRRTPDRTLLRD